MSDSHDTLRLKISVGSGNHLGKATVKDVRWAKFCEKFAEPLRTPETFAEYQAASDDEKRKLKGSQGWYLRAPVNKGKRKKGQTLPGHLITLDADYLDEEGYQKLISGELLGGIEHFVHTTRSHTPEKPKMRIGILVGRAIEPGEYGTIVRVLCHSLGIEYFDKASARIAQMMFFPTISKDQRDNYIYKRFEGALYDPDMDLIAYEHQVGDPTDPEYRPRFPKEDKSDARQRAAKAEKPTEKGGPVGAWCNAYDVFALIEGIDGEEPILGEIYEMAGDEHDPTRVNYIPGSGGAGAQILDGGDFLYSWHDSDPAGDKLLNSFDLVRIHLFGDKDEPNTTYPSMAERPSWKAMLGYIKDNERYNKNLVDIRERAHDDLYDDLADDDEYASEDINEEYDPESIEDEFDRLMADDPVIPVVRRKPFKRPPEDWKDSLTRNGDGVVLPLIVNVTNILRNDPRFHNKIAWDEFGERIVLLGTIKSRMDQVPDLVCTDPVLGEQWQDHHSASARALLQAPVGDRGWEIKIGKEDFESALLLAARSYIFNPVLEMLSKHYEAHKDDLEKQWCADFLPRFYAVDNDLYHRTIWTRFMVGAVMRAHEPGSKFDFCPVFEGEQGIGKSTLIEKLFWPFNGELSNKAMMDDQKAVESMEGHWGMELPELSSLNKVEVEDAKEFISKRKHSVRKAYGRHSGQYWRKTVFVGTTNKEKPLRDETGNRRFWMIHTQVESMNPSEWEEMERWIPRMWAEAYREYHLMRQEKPKGDLDFNLRGEVKRMADEIAENARQKTLHEQWADTVESWFRKAHKRITVAADFVPELTHDDMGPSSATLWKKEWGDKDELVCRIFATRAQVLQVITGFNRGELQTQNQLNSLEMMDKVLAKRGISKCVDRNPSDRQKESGYVRAPKVGGIYGEDRAKRETGYFWVAHRTDLNVRFGCIPWGEAHAPESESEVDTTSEEKDLI